MKNIFVKKDGQTNVLAVLGMVALVAIVGLTLLFMGSSQSNVVVVSSSPTGLATADSGCESTCQLDACSGLTGQDKKDCMLACFGGKCSNTGVKKLAEANGLPGLDCATDGQCNEFCATGEDHDCDGAPGGIIQYTCSGFTCSFSADYTFPSGLPIEEYFWTFGDGSAQTSYVSPGAVTHTYAGHGIYEVQLFITSVPNAYGEFDEVSTAQLVDLSGGSPEPGICLCGFPELYCHSGGAGTSCYSSSDCSCTNGLPTCAPYPGALPAECGTANEEGCFYAEAC